MSAIERLDAIDRRTLGATAGRWGVWQIVEGGLPDRTVVTGNSPGPSVPNVVAEIEHPGCTDAEFIAAARQDVPVMAAALRALLHLHKRVERDGSAICAGCSDDLVTFLWPCATVRIIETELAR